MSRRRAGPGHGLALGIAVLLGACGRGGSPQPRAADVAPAARPSILLVTLDTTRADAIGPEAAGVETPAFGALAARGRRFTPGLRDRARDAARARLDAHRALPGRPRRPRERPPPARRRTRSLAERLREPASRPPPSSRRSRSSASSASPAGSTSTTTSSAPGGRARRAGTTDARLRASRRPARGRCFLWVHYYDPHEPYVPPEPFRTRFAGRPYQGEVAAMDQRARAAARRLRAAHGPAGRGSSSAADHGEGRGDHGEALHGNLLYQGDMRVPLVAGRSRHRARYARRPGELRQIFHTVLGWAGARAAGSLRARSRRPCSARRCSRTSSTAGSRR